MFISLVCLLLAFSIATPTALYWRHMMRMNQRKHDLDRDSWVVILPSNLTEDRPAAFLNGTGSTLNIDFVKNGGAPSIVFEVVATDRGIQHRLRFPTYDNEYLVGLLEAAMPGTDVSPVKGEEDPEYNFAVRLYMTNPTQRLRINNSRDYSTRLLKSIQTDHPGEQVTLQWVAVHGELTKMDEEIMRPTLWKALVYGTKAETKRVATRGQGAANEQHFVSVGRIAAKADDPKRAKRLVMQVLRALQSENKSSNRIEAREITDMSEVHEARTPTRKLGNLFTTTELVANIAWPIGDPQIPGLRQGAARRFPATENIAREGWVFGHSDVPGRPRPIALAFNDVVRHMVIVGGPGSGKTALTNHGVIQLINDGFGLFMLDAGTDISAERLYYRVLNTMPEHRLDDVVLINPGGDPHMSVSINPLDQGFGTAIVDIVLDTFIGMYPTIADTVNFREVVKHGLLTLVEAGGYTLTDLPSLLAPRNDVERGWQRKVVSEVKDPELKDFWDRNPGATKVDDTKWARKIEPAINKLWNLALDENIRNLLGQTKSTVQIRDMLDNNMVGMVSLGGMDPEASQITANLLTQMVWRATQIRAQSGVTLKRPNVMVVDEFQIINGSHKTIADILARGRALGLGAVLATQFITRRSIDEDLRGTILQSANTQVVLKAEGREATLWAQQLGRHAVNDNDITRLPRFHGIAKIVGESSPVTFSATAPLEPIKGRAGRVEQVSNSKFARPVSEIRSEIAARRSAPRRQRSARDFGESDIPVDDQ